MTMSTKRSVLLGAVAVTSFVAAAHAQINDSIRGAPGPANHFIETPDGWQHPVTPWGEPDIRATLNMMQAAGVPLERCANSYRGFGGPPCDMDQVWVPEEQYNQRVEATRTRGDRSNQLREQGDFGGAILAGLTDPSIPQRQTNLIFDPPNGLLPEVLPAAKQRALTMGSDWALPGETIAFDGPDDFDSWDRCITRGMPSMMMPYRYNGGFRIMQSPGHVIFSLEMIHEARVIPTDNRPQISTDIRQYNGESRGRWEGNTLVVETTNYRIDPWINQPLMNLAVVGSPPGNRFPISDQLKTTERITRLNDDWWLYEITTEDPKVLSRPFTVRYPMHHDPNYWWSEYACHEDNTIVQGYVSTSRHERANPSPVPPAEPVEVSADVADALAGRWIGRPRLVPMDLEIEVVFTKTSATTVTGELIGTNLGEINRPLLNFRVQGERINFTFPNVDPWSVAGEIADDGTIRGNVSSIQGGMPIVFSRAGG